ncbi:transcriptional regulator, RpiR family [Rhodovulum sulfidophilum]|uniref:Transcriptional regulator, RpiR family n=1 Tax=Rhodovulum sulfidophilum TaxID=35806 RepID=A0A0D6B0B3_RHOSU|nr:transcriptional regulator, RpiR family [Rhodovulum sulfidophilum]
MRSRGRGPLKDIAAASGPGRGDRFSYLTALAFAGTRGPSPGQRVQALDAVSFSTPDQVVVLPMIRTGEGFERDVSRLLRRASLAPLAGYAPRGLRDPALCFLAALPFDTPSAGAAEAQ